MEKMKSFYFFVMYIVYSALIVSSCSSSGKDDQLSPGSSTNVSVIPGAPERFKNPEGYMTFEIDGKPLEIGISIASSQLRADDVGRNYVYSVSGDVSDNAYTIRAIGISFSTKDDVTKINSLIGVHKSSDGINENKSSARLSYSVTDGSNKTIGSWMNDDACRIEITSVASPWVEGTFTVDNPVKSLYGANSVDIKKGVFKIRYVK